MTSATFQFASLLFTGAAILVGAITLRKLNTMSGMTDQLKAMRDDQTKEITASEKFRADVSLFIARMGDTNPTAEQQALIDEMRANMASDTTADATADAGIPTAPETPPAA